MVPSPKSILEEAIVPSGSVEVDVEAVTVSGTGPDDFETDRPATGTASPRR